VAPTAKPEDGEEPATAASEVEVAEPPVEAPAEADNEAATGA
jgi:hypothetical protein